MFCVLFGLVVTLLLYFRKRDSAFSPLVFWLLSVLRFISATLLAFLLVSPMIRTIKRTTIKPAIVIGIDNSSSMVMNDDSAFYKKEFLAEIESLKRELGDDYEIETYIFGQRVNVSSKPDYKDEITNISLLFNEVNTRYYNRNIGAVILATDGIYNGGSDPLYEVRNINYPVFTIKAGDTTSRKDLLIQKVNHNRIAFKGNSFPVEVEIHAQELAGQQTRVTIKDGDKNVFSEEIIISSSNQVITVPAMIEADKVGIKRLNILLDSLEGEISTGNNHRDIFIDIRETRQKIAIISDAPHPDIAAFQRVLVNSNNFEVQIFNANEFNQNLQDFSLIIFHGLPSIKNPVAGTLERVKNLKLPVLFVIGSNTNLQALSDLNIGVEISNFQNSYNEALAGVNNGFSAFLMNDAQRKLLEIAPPLVSPFAVYDLANSVQIMAYQVIGTTRTEMPLVMFNQVNDSRYSFIIGEGIWKWRMFDYMTNDTHDNFDGIIGKIVQYLTVQSDRGKFRVTWNNYYAENENVEFNAVLLNDSQEPITEPEVLLTITDENKKKFDYTFTPANKSYNLKVGTFPAGIYTFEATAKVAGEPLKKMGSFVVTAIDMEDVNLVANHKILNMIARESGGESVYPAGMQSLAETIKNRADVKPMTYARQNYLDLIDYIPLMILLFILLGAEWFLRKYHGSY